MLTDIEMSTLSLCTGHLGDSKVHWANTMPAFRGSSKVWGTKEPIAVSRIFQNGFWRVMKMFSTSFLIDGNH